MILCIIQARMGSSRLPGKVMLEVCNRPLLQLEIERVRHARKIDGIFVATTVLQPDLRIKELCQVIGTECYLGSETDVLDRYYKAAKAFGATQGDSIIRITADCPLIDPTVIDNVIELFMETDADYASNVNPPTYPDGLDVEVFKFSALERAWNEACLVSEREHVTPFIKNHNEYFKQANLVNSVDLSGLRWTVDEPEDFEFVKSVYENMYYENPLFLTTQILEFLKVHPEIAAKNRGFYRNEGYDISLKNDRMIK